eukprot:SAG25_NODE_9093_length_388_cov_0.871972_1_plen_65_part_10
MAPSVVIIAVAMLLGSWCCARAAHSVGGGWRWRWWLRPRWWLRLGERALGELAHAPGDHLVVKSG